MARKVWLLRRPQPLRVRCRCSLWFLWILRRFSAFFPQSKTMQVWPIGNCELSIGVSASASDCLSVCLCGLAVNCQRVRGLTLPPTNAGTGYQVPPVTLSARGAVTGNRCSASESVIHILASGQVHRLLFLLLFYQMMHLMTQHPPLPQKQKFQSNNSGFLFLLATKSSDHRSRIALQMAMSLLFLPPDPLPNGLLQQTPGPLHVYQ